MIAYRALASCVVLAGLCAAPVAFSSPVAAQEQVDVDVFYDRLDPYGAWFDSPQYGLVWQPSEVPDGWRPYSDGHWVWTDEYGWYWESDAPWSWATDHYGRWYLDAQYGWAWVPGAEWAPAWVAWRSGEGYMGWAPLPPSVGWRTDRGLSYAGGDVSKALPPRAWVFVDERSMFAPRAYQVAYAPNRNAALIGRTRYVTRYRSGEHGVFNEGIPVARAELFTHAPPPRMRISRATRVDDRGRDPGERDTLRVYRPEARLVVGSRRREAPRAATRTPVVRMSAGRSDAPPARSVRPSPEPIRRQAAPSAGGRLQAPPSSPGNRDRKRAYREEDDASRAPAPNDGRLHRKPHREESDR